MEKKRFFQQILEYIKVNEASLQRDADNVKKNFLLDNGLTEYDKWDKDGWSIVEDFYLLIEPTPNEEMEDWIVANEMTRLSGLIQWMEAEGEQCIKHYDEYMESFVHDSTCDTPINMEEFENVKVTICYTYSTDGMFKELGKVLFNKNEAEFKSDEEKARKLLYDKLDVCDLDNKLYDLAQDLFQKCVADVEAEYDVDCDDEEKWYDCEYESFVAEVIARIKEK